MAPTGLRETPQIPYPWRSAVAYRALSRNRRVSARREDVATRLRVVWKHWGLPRAEPLRHLDARERARTSYRPDLRRRRRCRNSGQWRHSSEHARLRAAAATERTGFLGIGHPATVVRSRKAVFLRSRNSTWASPNAALSSSHSASSSSSRPSADEHIRRPGRPTDPRRPGRPTDPRRPGRSTDPRRPGRSTDPRRPRRLARDGDAGGERRWPFRGRRSATRTPTRRQRRPDTHAPAAPPGRTRQPDHRRKGSCQRNAGTPGQRLSIRPLRESRRACDIISCPRANQEECPWTCS